MLVFLLAMFLVDRLAAIPRSVPLIAWFVMIVLLSAPRVAYRIWMAPAAAGRGNGRAAHLRFGLRGRTGDSAVRAGFERRA